MRETRFLYLSSYFSTFFSEADYFQKQNQIQAMNYNNNKIKSISLNSRDNCFNFFLSYIFLLILTRGYLNELCRMQNERV